MFFVLVFCCLFGVVFHLLGVFIRVESVLLLKRGGCVVEKFLFRPRGSRVLVHFGSPDGVGYGSEVTYGSGGDVGGKSVGAV